MECDENVIMRPAFVTKTNKLPFHDVGFRKEYKLLHFEEINTVLKIVWNVSVTAFSK